MVKRKLYPILIVTIGALLVSCSNGKSDKLVEPTTTTKQEATSSKETSSEEVSFDKIKLEEPTTKVPSSANGWNPAEEGETLCYEAYSDEQFEEMEKVFENEMSQQMLSYMNSGESVWIGPLYWECILLSNMELNPSVDNEIYSVEHKELEYFDDKRGLDIQAHFPRIEIKGNKEATDVVGWENNKFFIEGRDATQEEVIEYMDNDKFSYAIPRYKDVESIMNME